MAQEPRTSTLTVRLTKTQRTELKALADSVGMSLSAFGHSRIVRTLAGVKAGRTRRTRAQEGPQGDAA